MTTPSIDIIVPVWNQPYETRATLVSILGTAPSARLLIINNGCDRETELMLEEFSDALGDRALYMTTERNIGFVPAINFGLSRSDAEWTTIIRPGTIVSGEWLEGMTKTAGDNTGIISPAFPESNPRISCSCIETCKISFSAMMLSRRVFKETGNFDEELDGGEWCLHDFQQRVTAAGHLTVMAPSVMITSGIEQKFGSEERRRNLEKTSEEIVYRRWTKPRNFAIYVPQEAEEEYLAKAMESIVAAARLGNRFTIFMHRKQHIMATKLGWQCLHTCIDIARLTSIMPKRNLSKQIKLLQGRTTGLEIIKGIDGIPVPGYDYALPFTTIQTLLKETSK